MGIISKALSWTLGTVFFVVVVTADDISTRLRNKSGANKQF